MRTPAIILSFFLLTIANYSEASTPLGVKYEIIKETPNNKLRKDNLEIRLSKKIDERVLRKIAITLRRDRKQYDRLWIAYYLPGMVTGKGAWATTHFTPDLKVIILAATKKDDKVLNTASIEAGVIIGKWRDNRPMVENTMIIFRKNGKLKLKTSFKDGSSGVKEIKEKKVNGKTRYDYVKTFHGEYYMLERNNNLGMYDRDGKFGEAKRIR